MRVSNTEIKGKALPEKSFGENDEYIFFFFLQLAKSGKKIMKKNLPPKQS
jgi:hypothetical protein